MQCHRFCLAFLAAMLTTVTSLRLVNNGYEDVVVAIHEEVKEEDFDIMREQIETMFRTGSRYLYEALDKRVFFRSVTILLPENWIDTSWPSVDNLTFKEADIRVDFPHPSHGPDPYVFQPGQCGEPGRYIHFTPKFLMNAENFTVNNYGDMGRVLVHEFAHYRYGVFDEYGYRNSRHHPLWYLSYHNAVPTGCAKNPAGEARENGRECYSRKSDGLLTDDCIFVHDINNNTITASIMAYYPVINVTKFCKTEARSSDESHNFKAPNTHNKMCNKQGTYDVIMKHKDFRDGNSPRAGLDVTPTFRVVKAGKPEKCGRRTVLVLDLSGSMSMNNRYFKVGQAGDRLIRDILPRGTEFGVVTFTSSGTVWTPMTLIADEATRTRLASGLPTLDDFNGGTSISSGLETALELLKRNAQNTKDANIVLITDGETSEDLIALSLPLLLAAKVKVHSIGLGPDAEGTIGNISTETGGSFSYYSESMTSTGLDAAMERLLEYVSVCDREGGIEIDRQGILITSFMSPLSRTVALDDTIGVDTIFSFAAPEGVTMTVVLTDPDGYTFDHSALEYDFTAALNIIRFRFDFSVDGEWTYSISVDSASPQLVTAVVKSWVRVNVTHPVEVESWLNTTSLNFWRNNSVAVITTYVHRGYEPMIRVNVTVTVDRSPDTPVDLHLRDDGLLPDNRENDGVYTAYLTEFSRGQRISLQTRVTNIPGESGILVSGGEGASGAVSLYHNTTSKPVLEPVKNFTRTSSPGAVDVAGFTPGADLFPPGAVSDLEVVSFDAGERTVNLSWTSPGDDLTEGTVSRYELRVDDDANTLMFNFSNCLLLNDTHLQTGSFAPSLAGTPHHVVLSLPEDLFSGSYVFALKAFDETNKSSEISNFCTVTFERIYLQGKPVIEIDAKPTTEAMEVNKTKATDKNLAEKDDVKDVSNLPIILGAVTGIVVLLIVIIVIVYIRHRKKYTVTSVPL